MGDYLRALDLSLSVRYSPHTRRNVLSQAERFLQTVGEKSAYDRDDILHFADLLVRKGYKEASIKTILATVKALFTANNLLWPIHARDLHLGLPEEDPVTPTLSPGEVWLLIQGVKEKPGFPRAVVALATIYGLRSDEIVRVLGQGCNGQILEVQTAKLGRKRRHLIPPILRTALTFEKTETTTRYLHSLFEKLMRAHVRDPRPREGWHALRRSLLTGFYQSPLREELFELWMGWRNRGERHIGREYNKPDPLLLDTKIYEAHPFLKEWIPS